MSTKYRYRGYSISNKGYYQPDHHVWWEAIDEKTGEASYHGKTRREVMQMIDEDFVRDELAAKLPCNMLKMREALDKVGNAAAWVAENCNDSRTAEYMNDIIAIVLAAISAPPRNCDMGSVEDQRARLAAWCKGKNCSDCEFCANWCSIGWENATIAPAAQEGGDHADA